MSTRQREDDELRDFTPYLMNRIMARYNKGVEAALLSAGVSVPHMRTLTVLAIHGACTINELSVLTVIKQSTLSRALDAMVAAGLIRRQAAEGDNRVRLVSLTDQGRQAYEASWPAMLGMRDTMLKSLDPEERRTLNGLLQRILLDIRHHDF